jgi:hypothetical protein
MPILMYSQPVPYWEEVVLEGESSDRCCIE